MLEQTIFRPPPRMVVPTPRWVRVKFGGEWIADSTRAMLIIQYGPSGMPTYYFPPEDVRLDALTAAGSENGRTRYRVAAGGKAADGAAWTEDDPPAEIAALRGYVAFSWYAMDGWFEEDEEIFVHARDPFSRVDAIASTRHVRVERNGVMLADSHRPVLLFETRLPTRYYLPPEDVRMDLLTPTDSSTQCPYKGTASYYAARIGDRTVPDLAWIYQNPIAELPKVRGLICFYNERVDTFVDGEIQPRPQTPWSE